MRFKDAPPEYLSCEAEWEWIMHVALPIGDLTVLPGSDVPAAMGPLSGGNTMLVALRRQLDGELRSSTPYNMI